MPTKALRVSRHAICGCAVFMVCISSFIAVHAQVGALLHADTDANNSKSNQSKVFYHDGKWWALAYHSVKGSWYIWKFNDPAWVASKAVQMGAENSLDVLMDSVRNKLYIISSHPSNSRFRRFSYSAGVWSLDAGFPKAFSAFINPNGNNPISLAKAKNGDLWLFRVNGNRKLQAKTSSNQGESWTAAQTIKTINELNATTDAVAFSNGVDDYIGVGYAETANVNSSYGFLVHRDGDPLALWSDETAALTYFGAERAANEIAMAVDGSNNVYLFTRASGGITGDPRNTLYIRSAAGMWARFIVNAVGARSWFSPAVAIDEENRRLFVMGTNQNNNRAEYKTGVLALGSDLQTAPPLTLLQNGGDVFRNLSAPAQGINAATGLMITAGDTTTKDIWHNRINIPASAPVTIHAVALSNYVAHANSGDTLVMQTSAVGALAANFSTITVRFPDDTFVPASMTPANITVNGAAASAASSNPATREITLATPVAVANGASFKVVFGAALGLLNPTLAGTYNLQAWTSQQPMPATSPDYHLLEMSQVSAALVTPNPNDLAAAASYTIGFRLGAHGYLFAQQHSIFLKFPVPTTVTGGLLSGVLVNGIAAAAQGYNAADSVAITLPAGINLSHGDSVTIVLPASAVQNPAAMGEYTLFVSTSVETKQKTSRPYAIGNAAGNPIPGTVGQISRSNQGKTFYHDGKWWLAALSSAANDKNWYFWELEGGAWSKAFLLHDNTKVRPDLSLNAGANKLYVLLPGMTTTQLSRLSYSGGNWSKDAGYPRTVNTVEDHEMSMVRAHNGHLWVFWIADFILWGQRSSDEGITWSPAVAIKSSLNIDKGLTDAVAFSVNGASVIGLGFAEDSTPATTLFGFLYHKDSDQPGVGWTDESASLRGCKKINFTICYFLLYCRHEDHNCLQKQIQTTFARIA